MASIKVQYNDITKEYEKGILLSDILNEYKNDYTKSVLVGSINNRVVNLNTKITKDSEIKFYDVTHPIGSQAYERGIYFLFCVAVRNVLNCDVKILYEYDNGIYCEILSNGLISEVTVEKIKIEMNNLVNKNIPITKVMVSRLEAIDYYEKIGQKDKANSLKYISNSSINLYKFDDILDYFYGTLPSSTGELKKYNIKYLSNNNVVLMIPNFTNYDGFENIKVGKNDKLIKNLIANEKYLRGLEVSNAAQLNDVIARGSYKDIIMISEAMFNNSIFELANEISSNKDIKVVLIQGTTSSGKTTVSKKLSLYLKSKGMNPIPISMDDFLISDENRLLDDTVEDELNGIDTVLFNEKISKLLNNEKVSLPKYSLISGKKEITKDKISLGDNGILIIEGAHTFKEKLTEMIPDRSKYKVYVGPITPLQIDNHNIFKESDIRLLRKMIRDNAMFLTDATDILKLSESFIIESINSRQYIYDANYIINTSLPYVLNVLKTYAEPLLFSIGDDNLYYGNAIRLINLFRVILGIPSEDIPCDSILREFIGKSCFKD